MYGMNLYNYNMPTSDERIWVQNENSAEAYLIAPNGFVRLWDSSTNRFYEKRADASGRPFPMETYEYTKITTNKPIFEDMTSEIREKIDSLNKRISILERGLEINEQSNADNTAISAIQE